MNTAPIFCLEQVVQREHLEDFVGTCGHPPYVHYSFGMLIIAEVPLGRSAA